MKYTKLTNKMGHFFICLFYSIFILIIVGLAGVFMWLDLTMMLPPLSIMWLILLPTFGLCINWCLGHILGDEFYDTGIVSEGRTVYDVVKTPKYYKRRAYLCFIEIILFVLLIFRYIFVSPIMLAPIIIGVIGSIVAIIIYYIVGRSSLELSNPDNLKHKK